MANETAGGGWVVGVLVRCAAALRRWLTRWLLCCILQALVNIAWSFATLLGVACCQQPAIHQLFLLIHNESLTRLRCTALALSSGQSLPYIGGGGFNEQALSNAVYAFDKSGLLSSELLSAVFEVSALRLQRGGASHHHDMATFKPQELCTLLKVGDWAAHASYQRSRCFVCRVHALFAIVYAYNTLCIGHAVQRCVFLPCAFCFCCAMLSSVTGLSVRLLANADLPSVPAQACHANIAPPWAFLGSLLQLLGTHPQMADSWTAAERLELHRACQLFLVHQAELNASGQQQAGVAVSAAMGLANSLANSVNVTGRGSMTGSSLGGMGCSSGPPSGNMFGGPGRMPGSGPPSGSYGGLLGALAGAGGIGMTGNSPRNSHTSGVLGSAVAGSGDPLISTFGQLPAAPQQQQAGLFAGGQTALGIQQQQRARMQSATGAGGPSPALMQLFLQQQQQQLGVAAAAETVNCPLCGSLLRQQDVAAHLDACLTANRTAAAGLDATLRQQQAQQQAQQEAAVRWVAQQQQQQQAAQNQQLQSMLASQLLLQQQQQQQNLLAAAAAQAGTGLLGLEELCKPAGGVDASALAPWMMEAAAASRPPLRPMRRL
jgi:hypothetical protein